MLTRTNTYRPSMRVDRIEDLVFCNIISPSDILLEAPRLQLIAHNFRRPGAGEFPLRRDQTRRREEHVVGAAGPSIDPAQCGSAQGVYDQPSGAACSHTVHVLLEQGAERN